MFSNRTAWDLHANAFAGRLERMRSAGAPLIDLTESNPTRCGLGWPPDEIAALLADPRAAEYVPTPHGLLEARIAISDYLAARGPTLPPEQILLTTSTSEAYGFLMKLLCDAGDEWLVPAPSYPLLELLARLEMVSLRSYPLRYDGEWHVDRDALRAAVTPRTRAVVAVSPGNPTGAIHSLEELAFLERTCAEHGLALVADEVFADSARAPPPSAASASSCLAFQLSGLSKTCGLPQIKAGWIAVAGPGELTSRALSRLEMIADTNLSVSSVAQLALPALLARRETFLAPLRERLASNRFAIETARKEGAPWTLLRSGGGWSAVIQVGESIDEEAACLALLDEGVAVQPGFYYDFERNGHIVVSLLPKSDLLREGLTRMERLLEQAFS